METVSFAEKDYDIFFTGTPPQRLRLHLLNAKPSDCVTVSIFFMKNRRLDVYHITDEAAHQANVGRSELDPDWKLGGDYILPKNAERLSDGRLKYSSPTAENNYQPK